MKNGVPNHAGTTSGRIVSIQPRARNSRNTGIMVTCAGSIIVESITMNRTPRPAKRYRANP